MEQNNFFLKGEIKGKPKDYKLIQEYMISTINSIKSEINQIKDKNKNLYIYYRYNSEKRIFNIFIVVYKNKNNYYKNNEITYLITIGEEYPKNPPLVFCLTDFYEKLDIFNMRNIQKNLVFNWKQNNKISDVINELPKFSDVLIIQAEKKLFPNFGDYLFEKYVYDLNEFLLNNNNIFFRIYYASKNNELSKNERYMIITKDSILFLSSKNQKFKNFCILEFKFDLSWIESIRSFSLPKNPNHIYFEFEWNNHSLYLDKFVFAILGNKNVNKIKDIIIDRKRFLINNFTFFEKHHDNDVQTIEKIIEIKEYSLKKVFSIGLYYQIKMLYNNIINIFKSMNDEGYKDYILKMQNFSIKYSKNFISN